MHQPGERELTMLANALPLDVICVELNSLK